MNYISKIDFVHPGQWKGRAGTIYLTERGIIISRTSKTFLLQKKNLEEELMGSIKFQDIKEIIFQKNPLQKGNPNPLAHMMAIGIFLKEEAFQAFFNNQKEKHKIFLFCPNFLNDLIYQFLYKFNKKRMIKFFVDNYSGKEEEVSEFLRQLGQYVEVHNKPLF